jgi:hypothetical protein
MMQTQIQVNASASSLCRGPTPGPYPVAPATALLASVTSTDAAFFVAEQS